MPRRRRRPRDPRARSRRRAAPPPALWRAARGDPGRAATPRNPPAGDPHPGPRPGCRAQHGGRPRSSSWSPRAISSPGSATERASPRCCPRRCCTRAARRVPPAPRGATPGLSRRGEAMRRGAPPDGRSAAARVPARLAGGRPSSRATLWARLARAACPPPGARQPGLRACHRPPVAARGHRRLSRRRRAASRATRRR